MAYIYTAKNSFNSNAIIAQDTNTPSIPTPGSIYQNVSDYLCFAVFNTTNKKLLYSKYNFNFSLYRNTYNLTTDNYSDKNVFYDFLIRNDSSLDRPFTLKNEFKPFFLTITQDIMDYFDNYGYSLVGFNLITIPTHILNAIIDANEFKVKQYDYILEIPNIFDFIYQDGNNNYYTKYNFDFINYSNDFKIYGSKLVIFTDFLFRLRYLSGNVIGLPGSGNKMPEIFVKYFV